MLFNGPNGAIKFVNDYGSMIFKARRKSNKGKEPKILTPKQMLQRFSIAFAHEKAGDTSEDLLNEICQIIRSLYRAKEITEKIYNKVMNSIKL